MEAGETSGEAAHRELREETGLAPVALQTANFVEALSDRDCDDSHLLPVFAAEVDENRDVVLSREHTKSEWRCTEGTQAALNFRCSAKPSPATCATS